MLRTIFLSTASVLAALPAVAAPVVGAVNETQTVIVNAAFEPKPIARIGTDLTTLDAETIHETQAVAVVDLLRDVPGITFSRNGGIGATTAVRIRGAEGDQTLLIVDGVRLADPSTPGGGPNFANLMVGNIERIDVLKGPQSTLYGSQALGGVVNVVTRSGAGPRRIELQAEAGSLSSYSARASVRAGSDRTSYALSAGHYQTDGFSAFDKRRGGVEKDGYRNTGVNGRVTTKLTDQIELDLRAWYVDAKVDFDGFPPPNFNFADTLEYGESQELIGYAGLNFSQLDGRLRHRLAVNSARTERENFNPASRPDVTFRARGETDRVEYQGTFDVTSAFQLIGGVERETARYRTVSPSSFAPNPVPSTAKTRVTSFYVQALAQPVEALTASFGVRHDDQSQFGSADTARASVAWTLNDGATVLRANYGDGFKVPTLFQLFSDFGNKALRPEQASSWDVGVEKSAFDGRVTGSIVYFQRITKDQIDFASCFRSTAPNCATRPFGYYDNIARTAAKGVEITLDTKITPQLDLSLGYGGLDARNRVVGSANFNKRLARRAKETASVTVRYAPVETLSLSATLSAVGDSFDNAANTTLLKGYNLVSVRAAWKLSPAYELYARVENLADEQYSTTGGYGSTPREASLGIRAVY